MQNLSPLVAPKVVITTICAATNDDNGTQAKWLPGNFQFSVIILPYNTFINTFCVNISANIFDQKVFINALV